MIEKREEEGLSDKVQMVQQEKKAELVGRVKPRRGHKLFEVNTKTWMVGEAVYEDGGVVMYNPKGSCSSHRKVIVKPDCLYISVLNVKNVMKKLGRKLENAKKLREEA